MSLILQQTVRSIFSALNRSVVTPDWMSGSLRLNDALSITYNRLYIVIFTLIVFALILLILRRTRLGLDIRAVSQNRAMSKAMGIRTEWVDAMTFGLGSGVAGVAGVALSQLTNVGPDLGQSYIIDSFLVVVFGGVGNMWGSLIGGMSMGVVNNLLQPYAGAVLAKIFVLVALILFIQVRPRGLFPQKGRAAEDKWACLLTLWSLSKTGDRGGRFFLSALGVLAAGVIVFNQLVPASSAFHLSTSPSPSSASICATACWPFRLDLIWGYCGILSLGHAAFFAWVDMPWACI